MLRPNGFVKLIFLSLVWLVAAGGFSAGFAQTTTCPPTRNQVTADLASGMTPAQIQAKYAACPHPKPPYDPQLDQPVPNGYLPNYPPEQIITPTGDITFEEIQSCGYHPQREELACTVKIKQRFGFFNGTHEHILFCVDYGNGGGLVPVNMNGFVVIDEPFGVNPIWYFAGVIQSDDRLLSLPNVGQTLKARAILSWLVPPAGCFAPPWFWGNQADFRIRLDPN
jgi:hypothetical protein